LAAEHLALVRLLREMDRRLDTIEEETHKKSAGSGAWDRGLEVFKVIAGGWPLFALVFLLVFRAPLYSALETLPGKIQSASEIGAGIFSLKGAIQQAAATQGVTSIGSEVSGLTNAAIELLLRAPRSETGLISYRPTEDNLRVRSFTIPTDSVLRAMVELQGAGFIRASGGAGSTWRELEGEGIPQVIDDIKKAFPGSESGYVQDGEVSWELNKETPRSQSVPHLSWALTDTGRAAVKVLLSAISAELARNRNSGPDGSSSNGSVLEPHGG
jgi:hypothetical protein